MQTRKHWPLGLLLVAVALLGIRLAWRLTISETGWQPHLEQWRNSATGLLGIGQQELGDHDPAEQAVFWLGEVRRTPAAAADSRAALGAAWMLDAPALGFIRRHVRTKAGMDFPRVPPSWRRELDYHTIGALIERFETLCRDECLARIERAVQLDNDDVALRRAQALLLFQCRTLSGDSEPRSRDWLTILDGCTETDPENALYDYLAALHLWDSSAHYGWDDHGNVFLTITEDEQFESGTERFAVGLAKPHLKFGTEGHAATLAFLGASSLSRADQLAAAESRHITSRADNLLYQIMRWQGVRRDVEKRAGRIEAAADAVRPVLVISEQLSEAGNHPNVLAPKSRLRTWSLANLKTLNLEHPGLLAADEAAKLATEFAEAQLDSQVLEEASRRLAAMVGAATASEILLSGQLIATFQTFVIVCVALALIFSLTAASLASGDNNDLARVGWLTHTTAWLLAAGISFGLLGMFAAEIVWEDARDLQLNAEELQSALKLDDSRMTWAFIQWQAHHGPVVVPIIATMIVIVCQLIRSSRRETGGLRQIVRTQKRRQARSAGLSVAGSSCVASLVFLMLYLAATPRIVDMMDASGRLRHTRLAQPTQLWKQVAEVTDAIRSNKQTMARLQAEVDEHNRRLAGQEFSREEVR